MSRRHLRRAVLLTFFAVLPAGCKRPSARENAAGEHRKAAEQASSAAMTFVGWQACARCHAEETARWQGSHHDLAMQEPTEKNVLGNFENARFTHYGVTTTFFKRDGKFFARTDGPDGRLHEYEIAYTFGVYPLQQYLIAFPGGRYQALNVCWDARPAKEGGQRWFHLYPREEVAHDDPLHWTGPYQNWNFMCSECHSTNVKKDYVPTEDRYATSFSEINVSCEACHGPGSAHVAWAEAEARKHPEGWRRSEISGELRRHRRFLSGSSPLSEPAKASAPAGEFGRESEGTAEASKVQIRDRSAMGLAVDLRDPAPSVWEFDLKTGIAKRSVPRTSHTEIETCARCHVRRSVAAADYVYGKPLADTHRPAFLERGLYYPDGQIEDEVYEYGSFLQSKMYAAGVSCTDCHNPHDLKVPVSADRVCAGCHMPERFDTPAHHHHKAESPGARCTACHMPTRNYMVVHARHDHSFRVPRPDLSMRLGTPNACTGCHKNKSSQWAAEAALKWWGSKRREEPQYGEAVYAGREILPGASDALSQLAGDSRRPAIVRGTALTLFGRDNGPPSAALVEQTLRDADPYVRRGAIAAAETLEPQEQAKLLSTLLYDPVLTVRIDAARALASLPKELIASSDRAAFDAALAEWVKSQLVDSDRAEAHTSLGTLYATQGDLARAEQEYKTALKQMPAFGAAYVNLADLYRLQARDEEGEKVLRLGIAASPRDPGIHHALGLVLVRLKRLKEALPELKRASELAPDDPRYAYVYAIALDSAGDLRGSLSVLRKTHDQHPGDREVLQALASMSVKAGDATAAADYLRQLKELSPGDSPAR